MRFSIAVALIALSTLVFPSSTRADQDRCALRFPEQTWTPHAIEAPVTVATTGMNQAMGERFAADVQRVANLVGMEIGGLDGVAVCLATPEVTLAMGDLIAPGQRLHVAAFGEEKLLALSAVEIRMVDDAIAYGLPHIALWQVAADLGRTAGYPEPLGSTIAHWYLARDIDRTERYHAQLVVSLFLDDPNPEERTAADATQWVGTAGDDPLFFDPQFIASPMGDFIGYAVGTRGLDVLTDLDQDTWGGLEKEWRMALRDELLEGRTGSYGAEWGVAIVAIFVLLAVLLAWGKHRQKKKAALRRPTPPVDESLFTVNQR